MTTSSLLGVPVAITGGAHGIGKAIADQFTRAGARVAIGDLDVAAAEDVARSLGGDAIGMVLDVTDRDAFAGFLDAAGEHHGPLGVLVNNAGIDWIGPFHEEPDEVTRREVEVNMIGTIIGSRLALQRMLPRRAGTYRQRRVRRRARPAPGQRFLRRDETRHRRAHRVAAARIQAHRSPLLAHPTGPGRNSDARRPGPTAAPSRRHS
jgi:NAD(P)-dependent dehydrogenase (short-subunit alcohol dehydrogenase family)